MARGGRVIYKRAGGRKRKSRSRAADDDEEEEDQDYVFGEEDEEDSESFEESYASSLDASEEEFEFGESSSGSDEEEEEIEVEDDEEEEEEEIELVRSKPRRGASNGWRTIKKPSVLDDEEEVSVTKKSARSGSRRKKSGDSDYEVEEEDDDEDFSPDEDEEVEEDAFFVYGGRSGCRKKRSSKQDRKKRKTGVLKQKREKKTFKAPTRKRRRRARISDEDDDDFMVEDRIAVDKKRKKSKKGGKKKTAASRAARKISLVDSETSDFEYMTSDDDFLEKDRIGLDHQRKKTKKGRKKTAEPRTKRKRSSSSVGSDSESSDCDYVISEEELRDLGVAGILCHPQPERSFARRKAEEKGKEKEADDTGKQVCGICLSEELKGTVQGVLNCCAHYFCFACIMEWSKVESRCPVCKRRFMTIAKSSRSDPGFGLRKAVIRVQKRDQVYQPSEEEIRGFLDPYENVVCMECQQGGDDDLMLLCDICDSPAHTYCVGLGREVPVGNWYCELCRSAGEGSSHSQVQDTPTDQGASRFPGGQETEDVGRDIQTSRYSQMSAPLRSQSSQRIDLNVSPRHFTEDDHGAASQASGGGASTLSGRRAIQRHIRILLSNSRPRQIFARVNVSLHNGESDAVTSGIEQSGDAPHGPEGMNSLHPVSSIEQHQQNIRPFQSSANLAACTYSERNSFRHVEGAKEKVQSIVKSHLRNLCRDFPLEHATFKEVARRSTHTILAACGIEHRSRMVAAPVQAPSNCPHAIKDDESAFLMKDCCFPCFSSFVKDVVLKLMHTTNHS